ncbi:glycosyltransferase [Teichococcus aestuarii]
MRILIVSDAWAPQVNGVVRTLGMVSAALRRGGDTVEVLGPDRFRGLAVPGEPGLRLALGAGPQLGALAGVFAPDAVHIATEGPLGWSMRRLCRARGWSFTTAFHTRFPDYLRARLGVPAAISWHVLRRFHAAAAGTFVATEALRQELAGQGFTRLRPWSRGVDTALFQPGPRDAFAGLPRPIFLCAGRVAPEKGWRTSWPCRSRAARWWWGTDRCAPRWSGATPRRASPASCTARRWRPPTRRPT